MGHFSWQPEVLSYRSTSAYGMTQIIANTYTHAESFLNVLRLTAGFKGGLPKSGLKSLAGRCKISFVSVPTFYTEMLNSRRTLE